MNIKELIKRYEEILINGKSDFKSVHIYQTFLRELRQLEHEDGHADEAPRYVKNILERLRELPLHDREVWLKTIMGEFEQDFSRAKWREGYEQGKVEGLIEREKVIVPQFVADYIVFKKTYDFHVYGAMRAIEDHYDKRVQEWFYEGNIETFIRAWLDGYEVEKEKRYEVLLCNGQSLKTVYRQGGDRLDFEKVYGDLENFTRKQLEDAGFGWVFDCEGIEIREVE